MTCNDSIIKFKLIIILHSKVLYTKNNSYLEHLQPYCRPENIIKSTNLANLISSIFIPHYCTFLTKVALNEEFNNLKEPF